MKQTQVRLPKLLMIGIGASLATMCIASIVLFVMVRYIPASPTQQIYSYLALNHYSSLVYTTHYYRTLQPLAGGLDAYICTPLAIMCAGFVFGIYARRTGMRRFRTVCGGAMLGAVFAIAVVALNLVLVEIIENLAGGVSSQLAQVSVTLSTVEPTLVEIGLSLLGGAIGALLSSGRVADRFKSRPSAGSRRARHAKAV